MQFGAQMQAQHMHGDAKLVDTLRRWRLNCRHVLRKRPTLREPVGTSRMTTILAFFLKAG